MINDCLLYNNEYTCRKNILFFYSHSLDNGFDWSFSTNTAKKNLKFSQNLIYFLFLTRKIKVIC